MNKNQLRAVKTRIEAEKKNLKDEYGNLVYSISGILLTHDPIGINFGFNTDEYDPETGTILPRLKTCRSAEDVTTVVHEEFQQWFGSDTAGSRDKYNLIAAEIWELWQGRHGVSH